MRPADEDDICIDAPTEADLRLLRALDGQRTLEQLQREFGAPAVGEAISQLQAMAAVEDATDDDLVSPAELARFDRQLRYFSDVGNEALMPSECQRRLREAKVAVLGVGGLGGSVAQWLSTVGIGGLRLVDGDRVEVSNLNRQILYTEADLGRLKVEAAAARLRSFNSAMQVSAEARWLQSEAEVSDFISGVDVVIASADWPAHDIERWCNSACFKAGIPYITMSHLPPFARVGPFYVPGHTGCFACQEGAYRRDYPIFDALVEQRRAQPTPAATLGPACGLIGGQVGMEILHFLTDLSTPSTLGVAHIYDLRTMVVEREQVVPLPGCQVCGHLETHNSHDEIAA